MTAARAVARRAFADSRVRTASFALLFGFVAFANAVGYRRSYPTIQDRLSFARSFGANKTVQLFYGAPHDLLTVGGYTAWRVGGVASIFAAMWGLLAAVRALRTEEEAGRQELVLAGAITRRTAYLSALAAIGVGAAILWFATFVGLIGARLPAAGSAFLALATVSAVPVFAGVGALAGQLAPTRRLALELGTAVLVLALLVRVIADTSLELGWLRWATPLGWVEELRPFAGPRAAVLLLPLLASASLLVASGAITIRRDVGRGLLRSRDTAAARLRLLSSPTALALRLELGSFAGWLVGTGVFALVIGLLSTSFTTANIPASLREQLRKLGIASITPADVLGFYFLLFVLAVSLFVCSHIAAARREEADERLETLFSLCVSRRRWLAGRLLLGTALASVLALAIAVLAWTGAALQHAGVSLPRMLEAGLNCLPASLLFLGIGALAFAVAPRASSGIAYAVVSTAFVWELLGALLGAPGWLLDLTPFRHVGLVPAQPLEATESGLMLGAAVIAGIVSLEIFGRRDLTGA